jgi:HK97 gp10 family phage protein
MKDIKQLANDLTKVKNGYKSESEKVLKKVGSDYQENVKAKTPVDSGKLKNSIKVDMVNSSTVEISSDVEYAPFVENGHLTKNGKFVKGFHMFEQAETDIKDEMDKQVEKLFADLDKLWGD